MKFIRYVLFSIFFMANEASGLIFGFILIIFSDRSFSEPTIASKSLLLPSGFISGNVLTLAIK
jgi:hypothetical protein